MKKILILYTSVGLGHQSIAENIGWHLKQAGNRVELFDVLQLQASFLVRAGTQLHQFINNRLPFLWRWVYTNQVFTNLTLPGRVKVASQNYKQVKVQIDRFQPDLVITTQTSASAIIEYLKQKGLYQGKFAIAFSDYHLHRYWLYPSADLYLVNIEEQKQDMIRLGIAESKIVVCGMTLQPRLEIDLSAVRQQLGLRSEDKVVLIASGSLGTGMSVAWLTNLSNSLVRTGQNIKVIIVCGKNHKLEQVLQKQLAQPAIIVFGYYQPLSELYAVSDVFITKPGGLTVAESLQWHLPMIVSHWLPGQEEINYRYLLNYRLIISLGQADSTALVALIENELAIKQFHRSLDSNLSLSGLTQEGHEGEVLVKAIDRLFHTV